MEEKYKTCKHSTGRVGELMDACTSMRSTRQILTLSVKLPCAVIISWQP